MAFFKTPALFHSAIGRTVFYGLFFPAVFYFTGKAFVSLYRFVKTPAASRRASSVSKTSVDQSRLPAAPSDSPSGSKKRKLRKSKYHGKLEEAWPSDDRQPFLPLALQRIVLDYLANDVDANPKQYSKEQLAEFKLFGAPVATGSQIAGYIASGARSKALELIQKNPSSLQCVALARDGFGMGRRAAGTPLVLAVIFGDTVLTNQIKKMLPPEEANAQLIAFFSSECIKEQNERDARYINAAVRFRDQLVENRLPHRMHYPYAMEERKAIIDEYRAALRPRPDDPVITRGFMVNPQIYLTVRELFLESEAALGRSGSFDVDFLWSIGFQSLLGAGPPALGQFLINGVINGVERYSRYRPDYMLPETLAFTDGTPFYDPNPLEGLGITFVVTYYGHKLMAWGPWRYGSEEACCGQDVIWGMFFLENLRRATTSIQLSLYSSGQTDDHAAGTSVELRQRRPGIKK